MAAHTSIKNKTKIRFVLAAYLRQALIADFVMIVPQAPGKHPAKPICGNVKWIGGAFLWYQRAYTLESNTPDTETNQHLNAGWRFAWIAVSCNWNQA